ncbi:hypothetical protein [Sphingobacterium sp. SYP-B4668]|uniref:hypothetical protein n=1 Tax=Sphingobacterium sp. SYP-B4668 TaxID=2996035 RepID=UPI0022DDECF5|nr:hypothetical protein [Sphingobacterium sp. SYP-B4668]
MSVNFTSNESNSQLLAKRIIVLRLTLLQHPLLKFLDHSSMRQTQDYAKIVSAELDNAVVKYLN